MQKLQIPKNRMNYLIRHLQNHYDIPSIEQGWELYHKGRFMHVHMEEISVFAAMKGGGTFEVELHLETFSKSTCTCSQIENCAHLAAVCFMLYAPYGRPELLLQELKQVMYVRSKNIPSHKKESSRTSFSSASLEPEQMPIDWQKFFDTKFHGFSLTHQQSIEQFYQTVNQTLPSYAESWPETLRIIYHLHISLFTLRKIEQFYIESKNSYLSFYHENACKQYLNTCTKNISEMIDEFTPETFHHQSKQWLATLTWISDIALLGKVSPVDWITLYRSLWWKTQNQSPWMTQEIERIEVSLEENNTSLTRKEILLIALCHFNIMKNQKEQTWDYIRQIKNLQPRDFYFYLDIYTKERNWEETLRWLRELLPHISKTSQDDFREYCQYWQVVASNLSSDEEWVHVMESLLPRSYYFYTAYLLKTGRYQAWVDLQIANRISPLNLYAVELQAIEKENCQLLLPLYHQATERAITEKNRNSYKVAMRLLTQLREYYLKLQQIDRWEQYIYKLADKYARLRSFQDELKRGNWIR